MKALILAAGFGTRLEQSLRRYHGQHQKELKDWVEGKPKGLVTIQGKPVVQHQLEQLLEAGITRQDIFIHTNALYYQHYLNWAASAGIPADHVFNNLIYDNDHRIGAVGDLQYALQRIEKDDFIVLASDTLLLSETEQLFSLGKLIRQYQRDSTSRIVVYEGEKEKLSRYGLVQVDAENRIIGFEEKPQAPKSNLVNASVQVYSQKMIEAILNSPLEPRAESGMLIAYLYPRFPIKVERAARRIDIGTVEDVLRENIGAEKSL